ncbi:hypothetical protein PAMA_019929 [Pampus argenteus]
MLDPSSSEDTGGESDPEVAREAPGKPAGCCAGKRGNNSRTDGQQPASPGGVPGKAAKDGDATGEEEERKERERIQKEEEERKIKLQIYVFVLRCIAYPFSAKQPTDMTRRQQKVNKQQLQAVKERFLAFLNGETQIVADEAFCNAVRSYYENRIDKDHDAYVNPFTALRSALLIRHRTGGSIRTFLIEAGLNLPGAADGSELSAWKQSKQLFPTQTDDFHNSTTSRFICDICDLKREMGLALKRLCSFARGGGEAHACSLNLQIIRVLLNMKFKDSLLISSTPTHLFYLLVEPPQLRVILVPRRYSCISAVVPLHLLLVHAPQVYRSHEKAAPTLRAERRWSRASGRMYCPQCPLSSRPPLDESFSCCSRSLLKTNSERRSSRLRDRLTLYRAAAASGFLKSERVSRMVQSGGCSANDFRDVFKKNIERRVRSLPEIDGLSKETVLSSWIAKYDAIYRGDEDMRRQPQRAHLSAVSELILSKEQLYEMFQQILSIRKFEHQLLYNACQLLLVPLRLVSSSQSAGTLVVFSLLKLKGVLTLMSNYPHGYVRKLFFAYRSRSVMLSVSNSLMCGLGL